MPIPSLPADFINPYFIYPLVALIGYLIGAIPTAYLVVKKLTGQDIRNIGSGNVGATNVKRAAGFKPYLFTMVVDGLKGLIPVLIVKGVFPAYYWLHILVALSTVVGHSKSIYLGFSGGKSAATGLGGVLALAPIPASLLGLFAFGITKATRFVSVGSIATSFLAPLLLYLFGMPWPYSLYAGFAGLYIIFMHKNNISRLIKGTENRI
ncbi:MAG: glycerol-3-phosphate 1-O-acyltransferase PlsY [Cyanobacteria bacterium P01_H01_bin.74]